jgi:hypothetical protein
MNRRYLGLWRPNKEPKALAARAWFRATDHASNGVIYGMRWKIGAQTLTLEEGFDAKSERKAVADVLRMMREGLRTRFREELVAPQGTTIQ